MSRWFLLLAILFLGEAAAAPTPAPLRAEIDALLTRLESSGCRFNRNGTWYPAAEAKAHLLKKLAYIERRGTLVSTEQFVETAASKSSTSGKPYLVQCAGADAVQSQAWLSAQLRSLRSGQ